MADNLTIPVATEEIGGFHYQRLKLAAGNAASTAMIGGDATNGLDVDVTRMPATFAEDAAHTTGDLGVQILAVRKDSGAAIAGTDGDYTPLQVDANGNLRITGGSGAGDVAHDAADSGNPVKGGAKAKSALSGLTLVAADDRTDLFADLDGVQIVRLDCPDGDLVDDTATNTDGTSTECIAAQGAGVKTVLTDITLSNTSASNVEVVIKDGTTARWTFPVPAGGGVVFSWRKGLKGSANTAWNFDPAAATNTITCSMSGYKTKV